MTRQITGEDIKKANTYIPIVEKTDLVGQIAARCIASVEISIESEEDGESTFKTPMPDAYVENSLMKHLFLRGILVGRYLGLQIDGKTPETVDDYQIPANEYDMYENLTGQLERFKSKATETEYRDKAYAILADYKDFEKRLNTEIHKLISVKSDICTRIMAMLAMQTTPEYIKAAKEEMDSLKKELKKIEKTPAKRQKKVVASE